MCWHCREYERLRTGTYKQVPWAQERWAAKDEVAYHYVHVSRDDPALVAYTASEEHGKQDRQTRIAPGRYLSRFYGEQLTQKDIQYWCGRFKGEYQEEIVLKFASEPDDIAWVYENGPNSCMSGSAHRFNTCGYHPTSVYGAGDLAVAYIENRGKVTARAICWPEKRIYGRAYGDSCTLHTKLEAAGYRGERSTEFDGARLLRVEVDGNLVCPYLDVGSERRVKDNGQFLIVGEGDLLAENTNGFVDRGTMCPRCGDSYCEDDGRYVYDVEEYWCPDCVGNASVCQQCYDLHTDESMTYIERSDQHVCERCLDRYYVHCDVCEEYHRHDDDPCESEDEEEEELATPCPTITDDPSQGWFL